jgi:aminopeptidase-like protein
LCHNLAANDGLSGVVVGLEVMRALAQKKQRRFNYLFLVLPETIGSLAWLSHNENLMPSLHGGLFLEMMGLDNPFSLQNSFGSDSEVDLCFELGLREAYPDMWCTPFRSVPGNDERQFNAPGVRVPMASLSRMQCPGTSGFPYPQYHSDHDNPTTTSQERLEESLCAVLAMLECLEQNYVPLNLFKGEVFLSRYGLHPGSFMDAADHQALFAVLFRIDGTRSLAQIAQEIGEPFSRVRNVCEKLRECGLVRPIYPERKG